MTQAPVRVAISTTTRGLNRRAKVMPSQRIRRPSASVFSTSIVLPDIEVTISPGLVARPLGMFSQVGMIPTTLIGAPIVASALIVAEDARSARHVELHFVHARRLLERDAAGIESDALADQRDRRIAFLAALVLEHDQLRRFVGAARHRKERAHLESPDLAHVEHAHADASMLAARDPSRHPRGRSACRHSPAGWRGRASARCPPRCRGRLRCRGEHAARSASVTAIAEARELRARRFLRRLEIGNAVERIRHAFDRMARGIVGFESRDRLARQVRHARLQRRSSRATVSRQRSRGGRPCAHSRLRPEADEQQALGGPAARRDDRERLAALAGEIAATQQPRDGAAARAVEFPRRRGHDRVFVDARRSRRPSSGPSHRPWSPETA